MPILSDEQKKYLYKIMDQHEKFNAQHKMPKQEFVGLYVYAKLQMQNTLNQLDLNKAQRKSLKHNKLSALYELILNNPLDCEKEILDGWIRHKTQPSLIDEKEKKAIAGDNKENEQNKEKKKNSSLLIKHPIPLNNISPIKTIIANVDTRTRPRR